MRQHMIKGGRWVAELQALVDKYDRTKPLSLKISKGHPETKARFDFLKAVFEALGWAIEYK